MIRYIFLLLLINSLAISSCRKSFLEVEDNSVLLREQYVKDIKSLQEYLNGIYVMLGRDIYSGISGPQAYTDLISDNLKPSSTNTYLFIEHYFWNQSRGQKGMDGYWKISYQLIRSCGFAIEKADEFKGEDPSKASQIKGEAYAIRALTHFLLVNVFAQSYNFSAGGNHPGVPYITSWDWNDPFSRNTVDEVYKGMVNDLTIAIPLLPSTAANKIVMNKYAAKALLARVYLFKEDWQKAKIEASEVASAFPLLSTSFYPDKLFTQEETEALFQLTPSSKSVNKNGYSTSFQGLLYRSTEFLATKDIASLLTQKPTDKRAKWISSSGSGDDSIRKYPVNVVPGFSDPNISYYQTVFRSSEMFLTVAESAAKMGDESTARTYLDAIRQRADPTALSSTVTGAALLDSIYLERRKELAFEGLRMFDLLRWKKSVNRSDVATGAPSTLLYPSNKAIAPIPQQDVNHGIPQNADY